MTETQLETVRGLIKQFKGVSVLTRKQLHEGYLALKGEGCSTPYFISKNAAAKSPDEPHRYDLARLLPENQTKDGTPVEKRIKAFHASEPKRPEPAVKEKAAPAKEKNNKGRRASDKKTAKVPKTKQVKRGRGRPKKNAEVPASMETK